MNPDLNPAGDLHPGGAGRIEYGGDAVVRRGVNQILGQIGPALAVVVLAAAVADRSHQEHVSPIPDPRGVTAGVAHDHVGAGDVPEALEVGGEGDGVGVESHVLAVFGPERVAGLAEEEFVGAHLLDEGAGLDSLAGIDIAETGEFVAGPHSSGSLAESPTDQVEVVVGRVKHRRVFRIREILGRLAETLGNVHIVPVGQVGILVPVLGVPVDLFYQREEGVVAGAVVQPDYALEVVPCPAAAPVFLEEIFVGDGEFPAEVSGHEFQHPGISGIFVI